MNTAKLNGGFWDKDEFIRSWPLIPASAALALPDYIPKAIADDYNEACLIKELSPKALATLSRRCLQGMIRDFWKVNKKSLYEEVETIKGGYRDV